QLLQETITFSSSVLLSPKFSIAFRAWKRFLAHDGIFCCLVLSGTNRLTNGTRGLLVVVVKALIGDECYSSEMAGDRVKNSGREYYIDAGFLCLSGAGNDLRTTLS